MVFRPEVIRSGFPPAVSIWKAPNMTIRTASGAAMMSRFRMIFLTTRGAGGWSGSVVSQPKGFTIWNPPSAGVSSSCAPTGRTKTRSRKSGKSSSALFLISFIIQCPAAGTNSQAHVLSGQFLAHGQGHPRLHRELAGLFLADVEQTQEFRFRERTGNGKRFLVQGDQECAGFRKIKDVVTLVVAQDKRAFRAAHGRLIRILDAHAALGRAHGDPAGHRDVPAGRQSADGQFILRGSRLRLVPENDQI